MARGVCALAAFFSAAAASSMMPQLSKTAQIKGDGRLAAVACCGADRSAISAALGATKPSAVAVVEGSTTLALLDGQTSVAEGALAVAASQVVPLLRRSVRLAADAPKKLLLLAVVDHEPSDASEAEVTAIAAAQLEQLWSRVNGPEVDAPAAADVFELQCVFLPHPKAPAFGAAAEGLKGAVVEAAGRYSAVGAALAEAADALGAQPAAAAAVTPGPAEVAAAYACGRASDAATKEFTKGLGALRKAAESTP